MLAWVYVAIGLVMLLCAGDFLVKGAVHLAMRLGIPAFIVSLTIVAFGTSARADVPKATMVRLTMKAGMPRRMARCTAPLTRKSPAHNNMTKPIATYTQANISA